MRRNRGWDPHKSARCEIGFTSRVPHGGSLRYVAIEHNNDEGRTHMDERACSTSFVSIVVVRTAVCRVCNTKTYTKYE